MRRRTAWRVRNNPLEIDLFERSSQTPEATETDTTETDSTFDPTEPVEMARNDEGNARKRLNDYARPVLQRPVTRIHAPLGRGANFRIDSHVMSMLPIFHGKPSEDPYRHVDELSQVCEINHLQNVLADTMKMKLFPATLRDRAKDWFLKLGKEFTSWTEMEEEFLRKYYSVGKTTSVRKAIREFTQGSSETFHEAWERLKDLTRECPHHVVSNHELTQIFYDGLGPQDRYLLDATSGGTFMSKYEDDAMDLIETVAENSHHNVAKPFGRGAMPKALDAKSAETGMLLERIDKMAEVQNLLLDRLNIRNGSEGLAPVSLQEASPCATCSRSKGKECIDKVHQEDRVNRDDQIIQVITLINIIPLFLTIPCRIMAIGGTTINLILHNTTVSKITLIKGSRLSSRRLNHKHTRKLHAKPRRHPTRSSARSRN